MPPFEPLIVRLMRKAKKERTGCWAWQGAKNRHGYGVIRVRNGTQSLLAHRAAYELFVGLIPKWEHPEWMQLDHLCRNPGCINPDHLELVSHKENMARGIKRAQTSCQRGHPFDTENTCIQPNGT